jgi:hypothetical protein
VTVNIRQFSVIVVLTVALTFSQLTIRDLHRQNAELHDALSNLIDTDKRLKIASEDLVAANHRLVDASKDLLATDAQLREHCLGKETSSTIVRHAVFEHFPAMVSETIK